ncbi:MAG: serine hydrolase [Pirellulaceae bacterium]
MHIRVFNNNILQPLLLLAIVFCCQLAWSCEWHDEAHLTEASAQKISQRVERFVDEQKIPGLSIAISFENDIAFSKAIGLADVENGVPATNQTRFRTASIAKSMTAVLIMRLVEEGKIDLDEDVSTYCPEFGKKRWSVSVRQVMSHLGGVRHYQSNAEATSTEHYFSLDDALQTFAADPLIHEPGTVYRYSSFGYNLLGSIAEKATGKRFPELLSEYVLTPCKMQQTVVDDAFTIIPNRSRGYIRPSSTLLQSLPAGHTLTAGQLYNSTLHDTSMKIPGGGLLSTAEDLVRFASAVNSNVVVDDTLKAEMWTEQETRTGKKTGYGLGWGIGKRLDRSAVSHSGGQSGTSTLLVLLPDENIAVAIMCNLQGTNLNNLASSVLKLALDDRDLRSSSQQEMVEQSSTGKRSSEMQEAYKRLDAAVRYEVEQKQLPSFAIELVDRDGTLWSSGYGFDDLEKSRKTTPESVFRVGSISKLFTDLGIMKLVESGKLDLYAPVQNYLPEFKPKFADDTTITLHQLMTHRSGLVRESPVGNYFDDRVSDLNQMVESLNQTSMVYPPGSRTKYSNAGIAVVGSVLEKCTNGKHADWVQRAIFDPLGMKHSSFTFSDSVESNYSKGFMWTYDGRRFEALNFLLGTGPAGNLYSSVDDLGKFVRMVLNEGKFGGQQIVSAKSIETMSNATLDAEGKPTPFGLGFHIGALDGQKKIGHGGAIYGYSTQLELLPDAGLGVIAVSALDGSNGVVERLTDFALRLVLAAQNGDALPEYVFTNEVPTERARQLVGDYVSDDGSRVLEINELNGDVFLLEGTFRHELRATQDDGTIVVDDVLGYGAKVNLVDPDTVSLNDQTFHRRPFLPPADIPERWAGLIGEFGWDHNTLYILERHGQLFALIEWFYYYPLVEINENEFAFPDYGLYHGERLMFDRNSEGFATGVTAASVAFPRREVGTRNGETFQITPVRPIDELRADALAASPPKETGEFLTSDLVPLISLDDSIKLDIRYATTNNFTGRVFYDRPHARMQRPAAQAVAEANDKLARHDLGLLIHDAYRPWYVTKCFGMRRQVSSRISWRIHNWDRGIIVAAVDLTLYDRQSGKPIQMVAGYDEFSNRSFPNYPGGTSRQRWYRDFLRRTMESVRFSVYEFEWWHFDYRDWKQYRIGNIQ